jgi:SPP1 family predicted phage head-tail adaptor
MFAGKLAHKITVEQRSQTVDAYGQQSSGWVSVASVSANIKPLGGRERIAAMAVQSTLSHTIAVRYQAVLASYIQAGAWRIRYGTRLFNITGSRSLNEAGRWVIFDCEEGSLDGN